MYRIGVDLGGTNIAVGIVDNENKIIKKGSVPTNAGRHPDGIVKDMADLCMSLLNECDILPCRVEMLGIASPGAIDPINGIVCRATNLDMEDYPIVANLRQLLPIKNIKLENDANAAALGEAVAGSGKGVDKFIMVTLGTGVGGGIIIDGKIYSGFNYAGGELGHMVIEHNGRQCGCGRRGCWEKYASATALVSQAVEAMEGNKDSLLWKTCEGDLNKVDGKSIFDALDMGDEIAKAVVDRYLYYVAIGLANVINALQPEAVCIGGGISGQGEKILKPIRDIVKAERYSVYAEKQAAIIPAALGNDAGIIGAALLDD